MKPNVNNQNGLARKTLVFSGIFVLAAVAFSVGMFTGSMRDLERNNQDAMVLDRLVQASRCNLLIQKLNKGQTADVQQILKFALAGNIRAAQTLAGDADTPTADQVKCTVDQFARDEKAHPDYYTEQLAVTQSPQSIQIAKH